MQPGRPITAQMSNIVVQASGDYDRHVLTKSVLKVNRAYQTNLSLPSCSNLVLAYQSPPKLDAKSLFSPSDL
jgi:hypothetical protein